MLDVLSPPLVLPSRTRSTSEPRPTLKLDADARFFQLVLPDLFLPEGAGVRLILVGPDGAVMQRIERPASAFSRGNAVLFGDEAHPLTPGHYRLDVTPVGDEALPIATFDFALVLSQR